MAAINSTKGLAKLLESGEFVLFLGAGVGVEAGLPDWKDALLTLAGELQPLNEPYANLVRLEAEAGRYLKAAELLWVASITNAQRTSLLEAVFEKTPNITRRLKLLTQTRCQGIVTTNFDRSLPLAATEANAPLVHFGESDEDLAAARVATKRFLVRLHGRIEVSETLIFAERHYTRLIDRGPYVEFFRELFLSRNLIFFGFSFADPVITQLMSEISKAVRSVFRRDAYVLLPAPIDSRLEETLRQLNIVAVSYDPANNHQEAWELFDQYRVGPTPITPEQYETEQLRSHLAAAYARAKGKEFRADRDRMLSALMMPVLAESGTNAVLNVEDFLATVERRLGLPRSFDRAHLREAVKLLERDGALVLQGTNLLIGDVSESDELRKDADRLVSGLLARAQIRYGATNLDSQRDLLAQVIINALALDGLHLAHTLIKHQPLDAERLERVVGDAIAHARLERRYVETAQRAIVEIMVAPDPEEEEILSNISAVVFGTALLLSDPLLAEDVASPFERGAYVDASVLLPWLATYHPLQIAYGSVLRSFGLGRVRVLSGYLNEVIHHKGLAIAAAEEAGFADIERFKRYASLFELHNINVFLGGWAGALEHGHISSFEEYLRRVAPFDTEAQLKTHLEAQGIRVEQYQLKDRGLAGELKAAIRDQGKNREEVVILHDAAQLEVLRGIKASKSRPFFVTADRSMVRAIPHTSLSHLLANVLLPQQVAYLAQMADRTTMGMQAFSRTLWTVGANVAEKIRRYYTDRILREYDAGLVAKVETILEMLLKDMKAEGFDLDDDSIRDPRSEAGRQKLFSRLDRFESNFFRYLSEAKGKK